MNDRPPRTEGMLHLSWSRISSYDLCGISFNNGYVLEQRTERTVSAWKGSLVDLLIQRALYPPMGAGYDLPLELAANWLGKMLWEQGIYDSGKIYSHWDPSPFNPFQGEIDNALAMTRGYMDEVGNELELDFAGPRPLQRFLRVVLEAPEGPIEVLSVPDIIDRYGSIRSIKVRDRNRTKEVQKSEQLSIEAWAMWKVFGQEVTEVYLDRLDPDKKQGKTKTDWTLTTKSTRSLADHEVTERRLFRWAALIRNSMASGVWPLPAADDWKCSLRYCGYYNGCTWRRG